MNRWCLHSAIFSSLSVAFTAASVFVPAVASAGIVPDGSRVFLTISGVENICGPADESHNAFCATAASPTVPASIPLTTFTDPRGATFGYITTSADVLTGKTEHGTVNSNSGEFEFLSLNDTYTVHGAASGAFPITVTLHVTGSFATIPNSVFGNLFSFGAAHVEIGTFHPEATLTQFVVNAFPGDALNPMSAEVSQTHTAATSPTPLTFPLDVQVSYVKMVSVSDIFDIAYGIDLNTAGSGQIIMNPDGADVISFALPDGVFLTSALGATFGTPSSLFGDYNADNVVDAADYTMWRDNLGSTTILPNDPSPGIVTLDDYDTWKAHFGETAGSGSGDGANTVIPEPVSMWLLVLAMGGLGLRQRSLASSIQKLIDA